jgi:opacity protein-like surface antigen
MRRLVLIVATLSWPSAARAAQPIDERATIQAERQWHAGIDFGYALGSFTVGGLNGFAGGLHLAYGVSDAFNLRLHADMSAFDLPEATGAFLYYAGFGAEYLIDVLEWVPYVGLVTGPVYIAVQNGDDAWDVGIEPIIGLGYRLSPQFTVGAEARFRQLLLRRNESVPSAEIFALARFEYTWTW